MDQRKYLYHARINSHLSLQQIGIRTALSPTVLRNLDEGRFELLPSGVYARSYVRTFAAAVGLDPEIALAELEPLLPGAPDPLSALNARRPASDWPVQFVRQLAAGASLRLATCKTATAARIASVKQQAGAGLQNVDPWLRGRSAALVEAGQTIRSHVPFERAEPWLRWSQETSGAVVERVREFSANDLGDRIVARAGLLKDRVKRLRIEERMRISITRLQDWPGLTRFGAAAIDALLLVIVDAFLVCLISWSSGIPVSSLFRDAGWAIGAFCAIPITLYFLLFGGIAGSTLGGYVCSLLPSLAPVSPGHHDRHHPLTLPDILRRAVRR